MFLPFDPPSPQERPEQTEDRLERGHQADDELAEPAGLSLPVVPSSPTLAVPRKLGLMATVADDRALGSFLRATLQASGMSINEMARRIGTNDKTIRQYLTGRRGKPSLKWFLRFIELTGARVWVEIPCSIPDGRPSVQGQSQG